MIVQDLGSYTLYFYKYSTQSHTNFCLYELVATVLTILEYLTIWRQTMCEIHIFIRHEHVTIQGRSLCFHSLLPEKSQPPDNDGLNYLIVDKQIGQGMKKLGTNKIFQDI